MIRLAAWIIAAPFIAKAALFAFYLLIAALSEGCIISTTDLRPADIRLSINSPEEAPDGAKEER